MKRIVLISGQQGSGKSTMARCVAHLAKQKQFIPVLLKFADPLYDLHALIYAKLAEYGVKQPKKIDRSLLQKLGTDWARNTISDDIWVDCLRARVIKILSITNTIIIIDDVRFRNELFMELPEEPCRVRLNASVESRRNRAEKWGEGNHQSETELLNETRFDFIFDTSNSVIEDQAKGVFEWMMLR